MTTEEQLKASAERIRAWQLTQDLSDTAITRKFTALGSTKTYSRLLCGYFHELVVERWLANYQTVENLIALENQKIGREPLYNDLSPALELSSAFAEIQHERGLARLIIVEGDSGSGKTKAVECLVEKFGPRVHVIEATDAWKDSPMHLLGAILVVLGTRSLDASGAGRLEQVVTKLKETRTCLVIEEAHHLGTHCLNVIKTLINRTPGEFIFTAMRSLWRKIESAVYEEVRQLTGNRLAERIKLHSLHSEDVKKMLKYRCKIASGDLAQAAAKVSERAQGKGNFAFVRDVCRRAVEIADGDPVTLDVINSAITQEVASR